MAVGSSPCTHSPVMHIRTKNSYCKEEKSLKSVDLSCRAVWTSHTWRKLTSESVHPTPLV